MDILWDEERAAHGQAILCVKQNSSHLHVYRGIAREMVAIPTAGFLSSHATFQVIPISSHTSYSSRQLFAYHARDVDDESLGHIIKRKLTRRL